MNTTERVFKKKTDTQALLASIKVNVSAYLAMFRYHADLSEQHTKRGPGRKHKQGVQKYVPRQQEYSSFRVDCNGDPLW